MRIVIPGLRQCADNRNGIRGRVEMMGGVISGQIIHRSSNWPITFLRDKKWRHVGFSRTMLLAVIEAYVVLTA